MVGDAQESFEKLKVGYWSWLFKCRNRCLNSQSMSTWISDRAVKRFEHFLDIKTMVDNAQDFKLLLYRLMNKQQRALLKIQKARLIQVGCDLADDFGSSPESNLDDNYSKMATQVELRNWHCHSQLDRQLLLGVFDNKPNLVLTSEQNNSESFFLNDPLDKMMARQQSQITARQNVEGMINQ
jgi:hypothetical protein